MPRPVPERWWEYEEAYYEWMAGERCARLLDQLEQRIRSGQMIALGCWCRGWTFCHRTLIGFEMQDRGLRVLFG